MQLTELLKRVCVVLVETSHPGNIGAAARAMKTMGLTQLRLVAPRAYPHPEALARASGADDVLAGAHCYATLEQAVADCSGVMGTTARSREIAAPVLTPTVAMQQVLAGAARRAARVALVFGTERVGLTNAQTGLCHGLIRIPANPDYSSLNLAAAVQVVSYELRRCILADEPNAEPENPVALATLATAGEMSQFYLALEALLQKVDFLDPENPKYLMPRLRRLFNRASVDRTEYNILRGILTAIEKARIR